MSTSHPSRQAFLGTAAGLALGGIWPGQAMAAGATSPNPATRALDVLVSGGHLIDPASNIDAPLDIGITAGRVTQVSNHIDPGEARRIVDARGKIVMPGLVDSHVHVYDGVAQVGVPAEAVGIARGVTTLIDGGSAGATTFPGFREYVVRPSRTRVYALLNISRPGMTVPNELADMSWVDPDAAVRTIEANREIIVGIKVRMLAGIPGGGDLEVMQRTREAADASGVPIVVHIGGQTSPLASIFELLRPGDVVTHALRSRGSIVLEDGTVEPAVGEALARGVHFDIGHGRGNLDFDNAEAALADGFRPTTISSDVHRGNVAGPVFDLPTTMSKFVLLGMTLPDVVRAATYTPAQIFGLPFGTLAEGSVADLSVLEHVEGDYEFVDSGGKRRAASRRLVPYVTLLEGREQGSVTG
jgi:dihydroorotase